MKEAPLRPLVSVSCFCEGVCFCLCLCVCVCFFCFCCCCCFFCCFFSFLSAINVGNPSKKKKNPKAPYCCRGELLHPTHLDLNHRQLGFSPRAINRVMGQVLRAATRPLHLDFLTISYQELASAIEDLNGDCEKLVDSKHHRLFFSLPVPSGGGLEEKGIFWKFHVRIHCQLVSTDTGGILRSKLYSLREFCYVHTALKDQASAIDTTRISMYFSHFQEDAEVCPICMDKPPDTSLTCAHAYCAECIHKWRETSESCPLCRERLCREEDNWELMQAPDPQDMTSFLHDIGKDNAETAPP
eukprot:m.274919 g.274919  ORF g.274919 m.274919 type:complete len:299 (-) comp22860_c0_seq5:347-1243(-)